MSQLKFRRSLWVLLFFLLPPILFSETVSSRILSIPSARTAAIGGTHAALGDDLSTLVNNPAGLYEAPSQLHITALSLGLSGPVFSIANIVMKGAGGEDIDELLKDPKVTDLIKSVYAGAALVGPLSFGYVGKGLGFSIINSGDVEFASAGSTTLAVSVSEKMVLNGGYAFRIQLPEETGAALDFGVNLKTFIEGKTYFSRTLIELPDLFSEGADLVLNNPFSLTTGIGLDIGTRYTFQDMLTIGFVGRNVFTPTTRSDYTSLDAFLSKEPPAEPVHGLVPFDLSLGVMYTPDIGDWVRYFSGFKILLDYRDIFDFLTHPDMTLNPFLKIGFGAEIKILRVLWLRAGFSEGLLSSGLGLDYGMVRLNIAMFGSEMSMEPGMRSVFNILVGVEIRL
jgi:hypothetical protein